MTWQCKKHGKRLFADCVYCTISNALNSEGFGNFNYKKIKWVKPEKEARK